VRIDAIARGFGEQAGGELGTRFGEAEIAEDRGELRLDYIEGDSAHMVIVETNADPSTPLRFAQDDNL
jgi:hypothetical protein